MAQWIRRLPTEQEIPGSSPGMGCFLSYHQHRRRSVAGVMVSIAAFQAVDPGSIPGPRIVFWAVSQINSLTTDASNQPRAISVL